MTQEFHLLEKFLIVVVDANQQQNYTIALGEAFLVLWTNGLMNSHILIKDESNTWTLNTFMPYQSGCQSLSHVKIASFTQNNIRNMLTLEIDQLYRKKLKNFHSCPVYVAISIVSPFTIFRNTSDRGDQYQGIEVSIVNHIAKKFNFTVIYRRSAFDTDNGVVLKNGTVTGNMGLVG